MPYAGAVQAAQRTWEGMTRGVMPRPEDWVHAATVASGLVRTPSAAERAATAERQASAAEDAGSAGDDVSAAGDVADAAVAISRAAMRAYGAWSDTAYPTRGAAGANTRRGDELHHSDFVMQGEDPADDDDEGEDAEDHGASSGNTERESGGSCSSDAETAAVGTREGRDPRRDTRGSAETAGNT